MGGGIDGGGPKGWHKGARKHASVVHVCRLCGQRSRGNGGSSAHERACYKRHGIEWISQRDIEAMLRYGYVHQVRAYYAQADAVRAKKLEAGA